VGLSRLVHPLAALGAVAAPGRQLYDAARMEADRPRANGTEPPATVLSVAPATGPAMALVADVAALGLALTGRAARLPRLPLGVPWALSVVEPQVSRIIGGPGRAAIGAGVSVLRATSAGLAREELGLAADTALQFSLLREARAWRASWSEHERQWESAARPEVISTTEPRTLPLPQVDRYAGLAMGSALAAAGLALVVARSPGRAFGFLVAGTPTAARVGREAFAAQLARGLARQGVVATDATAVRRLDRVDATVIDAGALVTGRFRVDEVRALGSDVDPAALHLRAHQLIDPADPYRSRPVDGWAVQAVRASGVRRSGGPGAGRPGRPTAATFRIVHDGVPVAIATLTLELDPLAEALVDAASRAGPVTLARGSADLARRLSLERVPRGTKLQDAVHELQRRGHVVAVVSADEHRALADADCGIGLVRDGTVPWSADLLCGPGLESAYRVLDAIPAAREASRRAGRCAVAGTVTGMLLVLAGPAWSAGRRASAARSGAALFAVAGGISRARSVTRRPSPVPRNDEIWHMLEIATTLERLHSGPDGLTDDEAMLRLAERPTPPETEEPPGLLGATLHELDNPLTPTLSAAAIASAITGALIDAALIGTVLAVNATIGGAQRVSADRAMKRLADATAVRVRIRRNGNMVDGRADDLVPGDIVALQAGDSVPADCRLMSSAVIEVDESSLTGESLLVTKSSQPSVAPAVADRHSMLHEGTTIAAGHAEAVVVATGAETELGRTTRMVGPASRAGGVAARLRSLTRVSVPISVGAGAAVAAAGVPWRRPLYDSVATGVSLAVAAVPEGLPFVATVAQLGAASRLSSRGALVRRPSTIEALGRTDTLCFDKTGTLTEGRIRLRRVSDGRADAPAGQLTPSLREVLTVAVQASPHELEGQPLAHATDQAVVEGAAQCGVSAAGDADGWRRVTELPFEPTRGYHAVAWRHDHGHRIAVKGAPEVVTPRCTDWRRQGAAAPFDDVARQRVAGEVDRLARAGYRVLAVAERPVRTRRSLTDDDLTDLTFLGLVALADPVRRSAAEAVRTLQAAGVSVTMVTGDHPSTAEAIASELGLLDGRRVLTGAEMDAMDDEALLAALPDTVVFARTSPAHKVRIVELLRRADRVVAVTGDGANDAPAIRMADVGIALGLHGAEAAKEAADLVITDDRIETIADAIVEGRALWSSVRDALAVLLGGNLAEIAFTLGTGVFTPSGSALNARQLLLVNLMTDILPAMALAAQRPAGVSPEALLREGPESSLGSVLNREIAIRAVITATAATTSWVLGRGTGTRIHAGTVAMVGLVCAQLGQTLVVGRHSPLVVGASLASLAALAVIVQTPVLSQLFGCRPLGPTGWGFAIAPAAAGTVLAAAATRLTQPAMSSRPTS
jgi:cation-transporting ATPase I